MSLNNFEDEAKPLLVEEHPQRRPGYGGLNGSINSSQGKLTKNIFTKNLILTDQTNIVVGSLPDAS